MFGKEAESWKKKRMLFFNSFHAMWFRDSKQMLNCTTTLGKWDTPLHITFEIYWWIYRWSLSNWDFSYDFFVLLCQHEFPLRGINKGTSSYSLGCFISRHYSFFFTATVGLSETGWSVIEVFLPQTETGPIWSHSKLTQNADDSFCCSVFVQVYWWFASLWADLHSSTLYGQKLAHPSPDTFGRGCFFMVRTLREMLTLQQTDNFRK